MAYTDTLDNHPPGLMFPRDDWFAITPTDGATNFTFPAVGVYVGGLGDVVAVTRKGSTVTFKNVPAGTVLPGIFQCVKATGTTATYLLGGVA